MLTESTTAKRQILTVTQLNRAARNLLETQLPAMWVEGELTNLSAPASGHWYFTLKDAAAQVRCAMFRNRNMLVRFKPKAGEQVLLRAKVSLYEGRGDYQLIAEHMEPAGAGLLQRRFDELKAQLAAEGLFEQHHKQPLPVWPKTLGVITSASGAAIHDILQVLRRRFPALAVKLLPVTVQGGKAAAEIAAAIALANRHAVCDLLIVGRGGGSIEDLWAFNEEVVARAIFASRIPIVSAVGHETDFTIADFVADVRAPTPSAAAELVSPNGPALQEQIGRLRARLQQAQKQRLHWAARTLQMTSARLQHPGQRLQTQAQGLDQLEVRLVRALQQSMAKRRGEMQALASRLTQCSPAKLLPHRQLQLTYLKQRLGRAAKTELDDCQVRLARAAGLLQTVSPLNTLQRGYAIVQNPAGDVVRRADQLAAGDAVHIKLAEGELDCRVLTSTRAC